MKRVFCVTCLDSSVCMKCIGIHENHVLCDSSKAEGVLSEELAKYITEMEESKESVKHYLE